MVSVETEWLRLQWCIIKHMETYVTAEKIVASDILMSTAQSIKVKKP